jgi:hypothetical protein
MLLQVSPVSAIHLVVIVEPRLLLRGGDHEERTAHEVDNDS